MIVQNGFRLFPPCLPALCRLFLRKRRRREQSTLKRIKVEEEKSGHTESKRRRKRNNNDSQIAEETPIAFVTGTKRRKMRKHCCWLKPFVFKRTLFYCLFFFYACEDWWCFHHTRSVFSPVECNLLKRKRKRGREGEGERWMSTKQ